MNDFEYLYMIRQNSEYAYGRMRSRYEALMWKLSFQNFYIQKPEGIQVNDLYQMASMGFLEAIYTYRESKGCGLAHFVKICAETRVKTHLRMCRTGGYSLIDTSFSLDLTISEDQSLTLEGLIAVECPKSNPAYQAYLEEARVELNRILSCTKLQEQQIYELWLDGFSHQEIAVLENTSAKHVDNTIQKIKRMVNSSRFS